jgi:hypothetical protein
VTSTHILVVPQWLADAMKKHGIWDDRFFMVEIREMPFWPIRVPRK